MRNMRQLFHVIICYFARANIVNWGAIELTKYGCLKRMTSESVTQSLTESDLTTKL